MSAERRTRWGWHQIADDWAQKLVAEAEISPGDLVLDIGAGNGALTAALVDVGARVVAFELHPERAQRLRRRFPGPEVTVVQADVGGLRLPRRPFRVVANPPFALTTAIMRRLLSPGSRLVTADLVVPRHTARRWTSGRAPGVNRWARTFDVAVAGSVPRAAFRPAPPSGAAWLRIVRHVAERR